MIADFVNQNMWPLAAALALAFFLVCMLVPVAWRWSARRTERRVRIQDENGYGPAGKERVAELEAQANILESKINRLKSDLAARNAQLAQAEEEAAALHAERNEARLENQRLVDAVNYWQGRCDAAETRIQEARLHSTNLQNQAQALAAALEDRSPSATAATGEDDPTPAPTSAPEAAPVLDAAQIAAPDITPAQIDTADTNAAAPLHSLFVAGERPAPEHLPGPIIRKHPGLSANGGGKQPSEQDETDESGPPKSIDMDELARRIRALESGV